MDGGKTVEKARNKLDLVVTAEQGAEKMRFLARTEREPK